MNKSNTKAKLSLVSSNKKKKLDTTISVEPSNTKQSKTRQGSPQTLEQLATVDFWKNEIASLKSGQFKTTAEATERLIDQVLERLELKSAGQDDIKEFLRLVFESSDAIQSTLKKTLGI